ncbi:MAG: hypothetical protein IT452_09460 [Planctomycetia bacterium]|nr:hypothetical protein [Planctomycetia bacterium]
MKRLAAALVAVALVSCSSPSRGPERPAPGVESLWPLQPGASALGGALTVASAAWNAEQGAWEVVLRAPGAESAGFVRARWFADATLRREFRTGGDGWLAVRAPAGGETRLLLPAPYPFATTLGLDVAADRPAPAPGEGRALPGRLSVTPEQSARLVFFSYPDLTLRQYESAKHPSAPKLAVWRDSKGRVVAALEIHVRRDAKAAGKGLSFLHTNGKPVIGRSLLYADSKLGAPSEDRRDFVIFRQADGREVAVPWKPLLRNASFLGACEAGAGGLDAAALGDSATLASFAEDGAAETETLPLEPPCRSMANPTAGSLSSGAPVVCEYSGRRAQRWTIRTDDDMTFTPAAGTPAGTSCSGTLPAGSGTAQLGTLRASRGGMHQFFYESEDLTTDPACEDRLLASDGPECPGDAASAPEAGILSDAERACSSEVPGCVSRPVGGGLVELVIPCAASGGTRFVPVAQKDRDPGFVAVACDGEGRADDTTFLAVPWDEEEVSRTWFEIDNGRAAAPPPDPCACRPCRLVVVSGGLWNRLAAGGSMDDVKRELDGVARDEFDIPPARAGRPDEAKRARHEALIGAHPLYDENSSEGFRTLDTAICAARRYAAAMAAANPDPHFHVVIYDDLDAGGSPATVLNHTGREWRRLTGYRTTRPRGGKDLSAHFGNCHKWHEVMFIYHGSSGAFHAVVEDFKRMVRTPVRRLVFWSCWGAENIDVAGADFISLKNHLVASRCNCPPRRAGAPPRGAAHPPGACTACPANPDHCPYEGTEIVTAGRFNVDARLRDNDEPRLRSISIPLGIDFRAGRWSLNSPDGTVRIIHVSPAGDVTVTEAARPGTVFGDTPLGTDASLRRSGIRRNWARIADGLSGTAQQALRERLDRVYPPR